MKNLKAKLKKQGGFTLVEMLIVVAIIAILIAVSIPMVTTVLERARHAVDDANYRAAAGLADIKYLSEGEDAVDVYYYTVDNNNSQGKLEAGDAYGDVTNPVKAACTETTRPSNDQGSNSKKDTYLKVEIKTGGDVELTWSTT